MYEKHVKLPLRRSRMALNWVALLAGLTLISCKSTLPDVVSEVATLDAAIRGANVHEVGRLIEAGADVNRLEDGELTLHLSSRLGNVGITEALLNLGAQASVRGEDGRTALHVAATEGHVDVARALLSRGGRVDARDSLGDEPLHLSASKAMDEVLISAGAQLESLGAHGQSALHVLRARGSFATSELMSALARGHFDQVDAFLARGANPNATDVSGRTSLCLALITRGDVMLRYVAHGGEERVRLRADQLTGSEAIEPRLGRIAGIAWEPGAHAAAGLAAIRSLVRAGADTQKMIEATGLWMLLPGITADMSEFGTSGVVRLSPLQLARAIGQDDLGPLLRRMGSN